MKQPKKPNPAQSIAGFIVDFLPVNDGGRIRFSPVPRRKGNSPALTDAQIAEACGRIFATLTGRMEEGEAKSLWERVFPASDVKENPTQSEA